jgi:hypothetical protein
MQQVWYCHRFCGDNNFVKQNRVDNGMGRCALSILYRKDRSHRIFILSESEFTELKNFQN